MERPMLMVQTIYSGASASEVETSVTKPIEDALSSLENLKKISSTSMEGVSVIFVEFDEDDDINFLLQETQRRVSAIKTTLPTDVLDPSIHKTSMDELPIMLIAASSSLPSTEFYKLIEDRILPRLTRIQGVGDVQLTGGTEREIRVNINADKLKSYNLSILQVLQAIQTANTEIPAGNVENSEAVYSVRLAAKFSNLDELRNTVIITSPDGGKIRVSDVAEVHDGIAEQRLINRINGRDAIGMSIQKQSDANTVRVADLVKKELTAVEREYAANNVRFEVALDTSIFTKAAANSVLVDLFLAFLIVSVVCFLFLHNIRAGLIIMTTIPLSIIPTFIVMYFLGYTLNLMSLMALSLVVGLLVDDSIVVIENIFRHMEKGKSRWQATLDGCKQIIYTCVVINLVIVVVFLPMAIAGGFIGKLLTEFAVPIVIATICSTLVSFTLTPLLMSRFGKLSDTTSLTLAGRFSNFVERTSETLKNGYVQLLRWSLRRKAIVLSAAFVLFIGSVALIPAGFIGAAFLPEIDRDEFIITLEMNPQLTVYQNNQLTMQAERILASKPEVRRIYTNIGISGHSVKNNVTTIYGQMVDKRERNIEVQEFAQQMKDEIMSAIPGIRAYAIDPGIMGGGTPNEPIQFIVQGADYEQIQQTAAAILDIVRKTPGTADARFSIDDPRQEVQITLDREKIAALGLSAHDVGITLRTSLNGNDNSTFTEDNYEYPIRIGIDNFDRTNSADVARLTMLNRRGEIIELQQFADISYGLGASALERTDRMLSISVKANAVGRPSGTVGAEIQNAFKDIIPDGITVRPAGMLEMQDDAFGNLGIIFLAALVLIYLIMVVLYNGLLDPVIVLFSVPLSIIGALLALALTINALNILTILGMIVLIAMVTKNAILLVDFANKMRLEKGLDISTALIEAGRKRLRPILMTTVSTICGILPIALASGDGAEMKNGMAWVIIGGLTSSMLLTLVVVPVVYAIFHRISEKISLKIKNKSMRNINKTPNPHIRINPRSCKACWACIPACPKQVIGKVSFLLHKHIVFKNSENCIGCKKCIQVCPYGVFNKI
jgi:HAE1 family hydrophobic/amphiphilic exporter-1